MNPSPLFTFVVIVGAIVYLLFAPNQRATCPEIPTIPQSTASYALVDEEQINNVWFLKARGEITSENRKAVIKKWAADHPDLRILSINIENLGAPDPGGNMPWEFEITLITEPNN